MCEYLTGWRLPLELELLRFGQLFLDGVVHALDEHALVAELLEDLGLAGGVAKGVDGPRVVWRDAKGVFEPLAPLLQVPSRGACRDGRFVVHDPPSGDEIEAFVDNSRLPTSSLTFIYE